MLVFRAGTRVKDLKFLQHDVYHIIAEVSTEISTYDTYTIVTYCT